MLKRFFLCLLFFGLSPIILGFSLYFAAAYPARETEAFKSPGRILGETTAVFYNFGMEAPENTEVVASVIRAEDATPVIIENYLRHYSSPLLPYKDKILQESKEHGVKPQLIVAIAQQESNLGKKSPEGCFNAWGWAIYEKGTLCFNNWAEAIDTVIAGIAKGYCSRGLCDDPCEMMKKYTPKSNGSWCLGVKQFLNEMETGSF